MNTSSTRSASSAASLIIDRKRELNKMLAENPGGEFTLEDFCAQVHPSSRERLAIALGELVRSGKLKQIVRVYSRKITGAGIKDFESINDVPNSIHDWRSDTNLEVTGDDIRVIYKVLP